MIQKRAATHNYRQTKAGERDFFKHTSVLDEDSRATVYDLGKKPPRRHASHQVDGIAGFVGHSGQFGS